MHDRNIFWNTLSHLLRLRWLSLQRIRLTSSSTFNDVLNHFIPAKVLLWRLRCSNYYYVLFLVKPVFVFIRCMFWVIGISCVAEWDSKSKWYVKSVDGEVIYQVLLTHIRSIAHIPGIRSQQKALCPDWIERTMNVVHSKLHGLKNYMKERKWTRERQICTHDSLWT